MYISLYSSQSLDDTDNYVSETTSSFVIIVDFFHYLSVYASETWTTGVNILAKIAEYNIK